MAAKPKAVDWVSVEADYRAGLKSNRVIGAERGVSEMAVRKRAKRDGWTKDLSAAIKAKTEDKVRKAAVRSKVRAEREATDKQVVEANADLQTGVILSHRRDIQALRSTVLGMAGELGALANGEIQAALEVVLDERCDNQSDRYKSALGKAFDAALALGGRSAAGKNLVASLGILIEKERQAFGIDKANQEEGLASFLKGLEAPRAAV